MKEGPVLVTGGKGFLGTRFVPYLLKQGNTKVVVFDRLEDSEGKSDAIYVQGDVRSLHDIERVFRQYGPFTTIYHLASAMPDRAFSDQATWDISVLGSANMISAAVKHKAESFVFTSSNVTYGIPNSLPVTETTPLKPIEMYGRSKVRAEEELAKFKNRINIQIFRCPVITGVGRLGLQAILFEFISENKNVYVLGDGSNVYQFVDADDLSQALGKASHMKGFDVYTVGADGAISMRELYQNLIDYARSRSKIISLPKSPALFALRILNALSISPLGVYQYSMIGQSMYADTTKIKKKLGWKPKKTITQSFIENYRWYIEHKEKFARLGEGDASSNRSLPKMKIFTLLKAIS